MGNFWLENSKRNIFSRSKNTADFTAACLEWKVTDRVIDNYEGLNIDEDPPEVSCDLCEHEQIRWQFEIINENNKNTMMVGSSCIERFNIRYIKNGRVLSSEERKSTLARQIQDIIATKKFEQGLNALRLLYKVNERDREKITDFGKYFKWKKKLKPWMAVFASLWMEECGIMFDHSWYSIHLRDSDSQDYIKNFNEESYARLIPFLTKEQFSRCEKLRNRKVRR